MTLARSELTGKQLEAAQLLAEDELNDETIAAQLGVTRRTVARWKLMPLFEARVADAKRELAAAIKAEGIRRRENRLAEYQDTYDRLQKIVEERADDGKMGGAHFRVPGYSSGLMVADVKFGGEGDRVTLYKVDTGLVASLLNVMKQAAQDTGQWSEKPETPNGRQTNIINTVYVGVPRPDFAQVAVQQVVEIDE